MKNQARDKMLQRFTSQNQETYNIKGREAKKIYREEKRKMVNMNFENIEMLNSVHECMKFCKGINYRV